MTKGRKAVSKTNESPSDNLQRALRFGRGEIAQVQNADAINLDAIEETAEDIGGDQSLPQPVDIPIVCIFESTFIHFIAYIYIKFNKV